jgi:hypothetical protein
MIVARWLLFRGVPGALLGAFLMFLAFHVGVSLVHADPLAGASAPVLKGANTAQTGWDVIETYGPIWGAMLLLYGAGAIFLSKNQSEHWLAEGRTLAMLVAGVGVLGSVLEAQLGGASWAGVVVTLVGAVKMVVNPTVKKVQAGQPPNPGTQLSVLLVMLMACAPLLIGGVS